MFWRLAVYFPLADHGVVVLIGRAEPAAPLKDLRMGLDG